MDQNQTDKLYEWIKKIICSCSDFAHVDPCKELIDIFEMKNPPDYLIKSLRELIKIHEQSILSSEKKSDKNNIVDRVYGLFLKGNSIKEIANMLNMKIHVVNNIIDNKMKNVKKKMA